MSSTSSEIGLVGNLFGGAIALAIRHPPSAARAPAGADGHWVQIEHNVDFNHLVGHFLAD